MVVLGLTGSIAMGKSTAAGMLRAGGLPVHDSDAAVHRLIGRGGAAVPAIAAAFPGCVVDGAVDRARLGAVVFADPAALARLEAILHPMVVAGTRAFLARQARRRARVAVLDIPLLFETGRDGAIDRVLVVSAPAFLQHQRVLGRAGMTADRLAAILARQMTDREKRRRADGTIPTGLGRALTRRCLARAVRRQRTRPRRPPAWPPNPFRERRYARNRPRYGDHGPRPGDRSDR